MRLREILQRLNAQDLLPREAAELDTQLQVELTKLWQTDFIRPWPPTVIQEVQHGLSIMPVLWDVVPDVLKDLHGAWAEYYPDHPFRVRPFLRFASWIGGDRDGHPGVTTAVTEQTLLWLQGGDRSTTRDGLQPVRLVESVVAAGGSQRRAGPGDRNGHAPLA